MPARSPTTWKPTQDTVKPSAAGEAALLHEGYTSTEIVKFQQMRRVFEYAASSQSLFNKRAGRAI